MRILIATWDSAGGFPPQGILIQGLAAKGHEVHVAGHESLQSRIEAAGGIFQRLPNIADYDSRTPITQEQELALVLEGIVFSETFGQDVNAASA